MSAHMPIGKYLAVREYPPELSRRTTRWTVLSNHGDALGVIKWCGRWRQYCFDPHTATMFNAGCLRDLATFLDELNHEQRALARSRRAS